MNFLTVEQNFPAEEQYVQVFTKQQEILSVLINTESPKKMFSYVNAGLSTTAPFAI